MAFTINRKDEIKNEELIFIKQKFSEKTNSRAIYASVKFIIENVPTLEAELFRLSTEVEKTKNKYNNLVETIKKKHVLDNDFKSMLFAE